MDKEINVFNACGLEMLKVLKSLHNSEICYTFVM